MIGKLYLLPNLLDESLPIEPFLPAGLSQVVSSIQGLIAESEKSARRYLRKFLSHDAMAQMPLRLLNEHTQSIDELLEPLVKGERWGLISDAGLPCIADPGAVLVKKGREKGIEIEAIAGPCSIIMALQLSGFSGQQFCFHGYLPKESDLLEKKLRELEKYTTTQIWIEAPYRTEKMLEIAKKVLQPTTSLCLALNLTLPHQKVISQTIEKWKKTNLKIEKEPAIFLIHAI